ncbi:MAG: Zn-dependent oligopeptidase [Kiritimatiellia bacterium]|jgi:Zn-dependent oligopeptidase
MESLSTLQLCFFLAFGAAILTSCSESEETLPAVVQGNQNDHFRLTLLSRGGSEEAMSLFRTFRGRDANIASLLERRGLN